MSVCIPACTWTGGGIEGVSARGMGCLIGGGGCLIGGGVHSPPEMATAAVGKHPTGMITCYGFIF